MKRDYTLFLNDIYMYRNFYKRGNGAVYLPYPSAGGCPAGVGAGNRGVSPLSSQYQESGSESK